MRFRYLCTVVFLLLSCSKGRESPPARFELSGPAEVFYDDWGNAHIYARSFQDAVFLQCYEATRLRGFQLDYIYRSVAGRLSEWFGKKFLETDRVRRVLGLERAARRSWERMQKEAPEEAELLKACVSGINEYRDDALHQRNGATFPMEYSRIDPSYIPPPVDPVQIIAVGKGVAFQLSFSGDREFLLYLLYALLGERKFQELIRYAPIRDTTIIDPEDAGRWRAQAAPFPSLAPLFPSPGKIQDPKFPGSVEDALRILRLLASPLSPHPSSEAGSNNWAIAGAYTSSGYPLLADDPHLDFDLPAKFLETHLVFEDQGRVVNLAGIIFPGAPGVLIGHNDDLGWVLTTTQGDVTDLYLETLSPEGTKVKKKEGWVPLEFIEERICVRKEGGRVGECEYIPVTVRIVPGHGPLLNDLSPGLTDLFGPISLRWTGFEPTQEITAILKLNRSRNMEEAKRALRYFGVGEQNFVMADRQGNIGYMAPALIPIRNWDLRRYPPYLPLPGDGSFEWQGFYDYNWVPQVTNPRKGFIVTANNDPLGTTLDGDLFNDPFYLANFYDFGTRAYRITERISTALGEGRRWAPEEVRLLQYDVHSVLADEFLPDLLALQGDVCGSAPLSQECQALTLLSPWDRNLREDRPEPTLFHLWLAHLLELIFADEIPLFHTMMGIVGQRELQVLGRTLKALLRTPERFSRNYWDILSTPVEETPSQVKLLALSRALSHGNRSFLSPQGSPLPLTEWTWGKMHTVLFQHLAFPDLSRGPYPYHGGKGVVDASDYPLFTTQGVNGPPVVQRAGPNMRLIMMMTPEGWEVYNILPGGASQDPNSPHYDDQLKLWLKGENRRIPYTREEVERASVQRISYPQGFPRVR